MGASSSTRESLRSCSMFNGARRRALRIPRPRCGEMKRYLAVSSLGPFTKPESAKSVPLDYQAGNGIRTPILMLSSRNKE